MPSERGASVPSQTFTSRNRVQRRLWTWCIWATPCFILLLVCSFFYDEFCRELTRSHVTVAKASLRRSAEVIAIDATATIYMWETEEWDRVKEMMGIGAIRVFLYDVFNKPTDPKIHLPKVIVPCETELMGSFSLHLRRNPITLIQADPYLALISYGPDEDLDISKDIFRHTTPKDIKEALALRNYDPTNGTYSDGDHYVVLEKTPEGYRAADLW